MAIRFILALAAALSSAAFFGTPAVAADSGELLAAVKNMPAQSDKFRSLMSNLSVAQFHFVSVPSVLSGSDESSYKASLRKDASAIEDLRDTLNHTTLTGSDGVVTTLRKVLLGKNLSIDQIVAVYVGGSQITLFYQ